MYETFGQKKTISKEIHMDHQDKLWERYLEEAKELVQKWDPETLVDSLMKEDDFNREQAQELANSVSIFAAKALADLKVKTALLQEQNLPIE